MNRFSAAFFCCPPVICLALLISAFDGSFARAQNFDRPNVVIILADDLGYGDLRCYNADSAIPTPRLDELASQGVRLTDAHSPSAVCTPTRYGLLTGRYCWRTRLKSGVLNGRSRNLIDVGRLTIADMMRDAGYRTAGFGKWHLGLGDQQPTDYSRPLLPSPLDHGFDSYFGIPASLDMEPYVYLRGDAPESPPTEAIAGSKQRRAGGEGFWRAGAISPGFRHIDVLPRITEEAVQFIARQTDKQPFFMYVPFSAPHTPWLPTAEYAGRSDAGPYGDFTVQVDACVGAILDALAAGGFENTLVVFTSDNGAHWTPEDKKEYAHRANGPLRGQKADIWEGGHRVPFLARWPGRIPSAAVSNQLACHVDLAATLAAVIGAELPDDAAEDSFNLAPALLGDADYQGARTTLVAHSISGVFSIRDGDWKLIPHLGSGGFSTPRDVEPSAGGPQGQLYNLSKDLGEQHNLWLERPDVVERLSELLSVQQDSGRTRPAADPS